MKRLLLAMLALTVLLSSIVFAANPEIDQMRLIKQSESIAISNKLRPKVKADPNDPTASEKLDPEFVKEFGGLYLDDEGILNINIVGDGKNIKAFLKDANVKYHQVDYTLAYLNDIHRAIIPRMQDMGIVALGTDDKNNKVVVSFSQYSDEKINALKKIVDSPAIEFVKGDCKVELTLGNGPEMLGMKDSRQVMNKSLLFMLLMISAFLACMLWWVRKKPATSVSQ